MPGIEAIPAIEDRKEKSMPKTQTADNLALASVASQSEAPSPGASPGDDSAYFTPGGQLTLTGIGALLAGKFEPSADAMLKTMAPFCRNNADLLSAYLQIRMCAYLQEIRSRLAQ